MYEVERVLLDLLGQDVALPCFDPWLILKEAGVQVDRYDSAIRSNSVPEPARNRTPAGSDVEATPPCCNTKFSEPRNRHRVITLLDQRESAALIAPRGIEPVPLRHRWIVAQSAEIRPVSDDAHTGMKCPSHFQCQRR